jgi:hypothetical protein
MSGFSVEKWWMRRRTSVTAPNSMDKRDRAK